LDSITEPVAFNRSPRRVSLGVPPHQNILPGTRRKRHIRAVLIGQRKRWRLFANC
jgi:hypothetical protein